MSVEHDYFGLIEEDSSGGLHWDDSVEVGDLLVELELDAANAADVSEAGLDAAAAVIHNIEGLEARARDALVADLSQRSSVTTEYVDDRVDDLGDSLLDLLVHNSGDIAMDVLRSMQLVRVALRPDATTGDAPFAVFTFSIDPDATDAVLSVAFDERGDVIAVEDGEE
jgi:hypothetical protein